MQTPLLNADDWLMHARSVRIFAHQAQRLSDMENALRLHQAADEMERRARLAASTAGGQSVTALK